MATVTAAEVVRANSESQLILAGPDPTSVSFPPISACFGLCLLFPLRAELLICFVPCFSSSALLYGQMGILLSREHSQGTGGGLVQGGKGRMQTQWGEWVLLALA